MALTMTAASSEQIYIVSNLGITVAPVTLACWAYPLDTTADRSVMSIYNNGATDNYFQLGLAGGSGLGLTDKVTAHARNGGGGSELGQSTGAYVANQWQHIAAVFASTTSRTAYLDGTAGTTSTASVNNPTSPDRFGFGVVLTSYAIANVAVAEAAVWNVALDAAEIAALAKGVAPTKIRPSALVAYYPMGNGHQTGTTTIDRWKNRYDMIETNTPTLADHPRILY